MQGMYPIATLDHAAACRMTSQVEAEINGVIIGQKWLVRRLLIGLLAVIPYTFRREEGERTGYGHILLEGVPGLAKTLTISTLACTIDAKFQRIQFTPDMLPADTPSVPGFTRSVRGKVSN